MLAQIRVSNKIKNIILKKRQKKQTKPLAVPMIGLQTLCKQVKTPRCRPKWEGSAISDSNRAENNGNRKKSYSVMKINAGDVDLFWYLFWFCHRLVWHM